MKSNHKKVRAIIERLEIPFSNFGTAKQNTICPKCPPTTKNKRARCLRSRFNKRSFHWYCHHCGWTGSELIGNDLDD